MRTPLPVFSLLVAFALSLVAALSLVGCTGLESSPPCPDETLTSTGRSEGGAGGTDGAPPPSPPPGCLSELEPSVCPLIPVAALTYRCEEEIPAVCGLLPDQTLHLVRPGAWGGFCSPPVPEPWALYLGTTACDAQGLEVHLFCW